jgi:hypothetical protein
MYLQLLQDEIYRMLLGIRKDWRACQDDRIGDFNHISEPATQKACLLREAQSY